MGPPGPTDGVIEEKLEPARGCPGGTVQDLTGLGLEIQRTKRFVGTGQSARIRSLSVILHQLL